ncbi:DELLA protein RGL2 [Linum perenne]
MADQIFSKNGGIEVQSPSGRSNQTSDSEPFERWIDSPEHDDDQFPIPIYHEEDAHQISARQGISELGEMIKMLYYFSRALHERIDRQTGKQTVMQKSDLVQEITMPTRECFLDFREKVPFGQVSQFAAIQAVVDSVAKATFIHIVDFNIKHGEQWTIFMQALISREENLVDHLKITAIGTMGKEMLEETGERLSDFAKAMSISFSFNLIMVEDFMDLNEEMFEVDCDETVAVLAEYLLTTLISRVEKLDSVMKVIRSLKPCVMVVTEVESNHNSPVFVNRFVQALFYASAFFDCLDVCMERESSHRRFAESAFLGEGSRIIVAAEGEERVIRNVKMEAWRAYFRRFGIKEADLSFSCLYQAELVARKFHSWRFCTVGLDGKSLIVGWKGISELDQMIHGQVIRDEPVTEIHRNPDPDNVSALRERIYRQTGKVEPVEKQAESVHKIMNQPRECFLEFHEKVPFGQVTQFAAIQAVVDSVAKATRIHIVDFNIKKGEQWTIFMQALVSREENPVDILKITSIGTIDKDTLEETGQRLIDFAKAMALSFSYKIVMVEDLTELKENMFEIDYEEESVVVLSDYLFSTLISSVGKLDYVMKVILKMKPCVMVMTEVESNNNSPIFVNRFVDVLFYTSAFFDCLEACMERDNPHRMFVESTIFGEAIKMVVANEGEDRGIRSVKMDVWRAYFGRFGMEEADLSFSCVYQAELVAKKLPSWKFCTVEVVEKSLIVGWKGTPTHSVTAWNFNN